MPMNVNDGMHNPGVPFFPVRNYLFRNQLLFFIFLAIGTADDEPSRI
jgi:hypothetical protein